MAAVLLWAATPIATKIAVLELDPVAVGALRTVLAALLTAPIVLLYRLRPPRDPRRLALFGLAIGGGFIAFPLLFSLGMSRTSATHAALILAALPLSTGLLGAAFERTVPPWTWWLGAAIALAGEIFIVGFSPGPSAHGATLAGDLLIAAGGLSASTGHVAGARLAPSLGTWPTALLGITFAGLILLPTVPWLADPSTAANASGTAWSAIAFLAGGSTLLAFVAWYWALSHGGIARMGAMQFLQPAVTVALAALLLNEPITPTLLGAAVLILAGVALTQQRWRAVRRA